MDYFEDNEKGRNLGAGAVNGRVEGFFSMAMFQVGCRTEIDSSLQKRSRMVLIIRKGVFIDRLSS